MKPKPPAGWRYLKSGEEVGIDDMRVDKRGGAWNKVTAWCVGLRAGRYSINWYARKKRERSK